MVNYGPSRGCRTCKKRRKKCDEGRPTCVRCIQSRYTCEGYESDGALPIRRYEPSPSLLLPRDAGGKEGPLTFQSMALKCTLPRAKTNLTGSILVLDGPRSSISDQESLIYSLRAFLYDYCLIPVDQSISRGFLSGLEPMLHRAGPQSDLAKACRTVAYASHGIKLNRPSLYSRAVKSYSELLDTLARAVEHPTKSNTSETVMIALLLGIYEMILANEDTMGNHTFHAQGIAAMLGLSDSPWSILGAVHLVNSGHPLIAERITQNYGMFFAPCIGDGITLSLDNLMLAFGSLWTKAEPFLGQTPRNAELIHALKKDVIALNDALEMWQITRSAAVKPKQAGVVTQERALASEFAVGYWMGRIDIYFDLYTAGIWNVSRIARLLLIFLNIQLRDDRKSPENQSDNLREQDVAQNLIADMVASIPYHLVDDIDVFVQNIETSTQIEDIGKAVGGLLLMHPIYIASKLSIVPEELRDYMKACLNWIGTNMGIGQAALFSKAHRIDESYFAGGSMIVWAGLLV